MAQVTGVKFRVSPISNSEQSPNCSAMLNRTLNVSVPDPFPHNPHKKQSDLIYTGHRMDYQSSSILLGVVLEL